MNYFKAEDDLIIRTITQTDRQTEREICQMSNVKKKKHEM